MEPVHWALVLKPVVLPLFMFLIVWPIAWLLFRVFPNGRLKVILFKNRHGPGATGRDRVVIAVAAVGAYAVLIVAGVVVFG